MSTFRFTSHRQLWLSLVLSLIKGNIVGTAAAHSPTVQTEIRPERIVEYEEDGRRHYFIDFGKTWFGRLNVTFSNTGSTTHKRTVQIDMVDGDPGREYTIETGTVDGRRRAGFSASGKESRCWEAPRPGCYIVIVGDKNGSPILRMVVPVN